MSEILAIDPGPVESAWMLFDGKRIVDSAIEPNDAVLKAVFDKWCDVSAIEWVESYGMAVGKDVFETVYWIGRFRQAIGDNVRRVPRREVKMHLCHSMRAKDSNIRQALIDRFPATGGGKTPQIGTKSQPGPLYGVKLHLWSALAVAVTVWDSVQRREAS